ncbi:FHA domain-containing protein [Microbacterium sp. NPDC089189]|uniref:FHA domain-containing protein n=1 Tax=Microbacterium sp. NPDC089189 TaxID=3154972 RepID=UPI00341A00E9
MDASTTLAVVAAVSFAAALIVGGAWHVWYALGLARVFAVHDVDPWRAWVPVMNEAELFRLGRVDPVKVALYAVPVVNLYAVFLKVVAAHRINSDAGRGAGSTVLAVLLPPVWAMLFAGARPAVDAPAAPAVAPGRPAPVFAVAPPAPAAPLPAASAPVPPAPAVPPAASASPAAPIPPAAPVAPVAPAAGAPAPALPAPTPPAPAAAVSPPVVPPAPARVASEEPAPLTRRARRGADEDATAIVRAPEGWALTLPDGRAVPIAARTIVLGRNPRVAESGVQYVAVSDEGRTVSKEHARLQWNDQGWTITDLGSTNGVSVVTAEGDERALKPEATAPVVERFVLGDAIVLLRQGA